jgi:hypothetical protein
MFPWQVFLDKFYLLVCTAKNENIFSLPRRLSVPKLVMSAFGQRQFIRVYGRQVKLDKCTRNTSISFGKEKEALTRDT